MNVFQFVPSFDSRNWLGSLTSSRAITSTLTLGLDVFVSTWLIDTVPVGGSESTIDGLDGLPLTTNVVWFSLLVTLSRTESALLALSRATFWPLYSRFRT